MENDDIQNTWKKLDGGIQAYSKDELSKMLALKTRKAFRQYLYLIAFGVVAGAGFLAFLLIAMISRWDDVYYRTNNLVLTLFFIGALAILVRTIRLLGRSATPDSLQEWLKARITDLTKGIRSKAGYLLFPPLALLSMLSIHVYYEYKPFLEVIQTEESIYGLIAGGCAALAAGLYGMYQINRIMRKRLEHLKELYRLAHETGENAETPIDF